MKKFALLLALPFFHVSTEPYKPTAWVTHGSTRTLVIDLSALQQKCIQANGLLYEKDTLSDRQWRPILVPIDQICIEGKTK